MFVNYITYIQYHLSSIGKYPVVVIWVSKYLKLTVTQDSLQICGKSKKSIS